VPVKVWGLIRLLIWRWKMAKDSRWAGKYNVRDGNPFKTGHISRNMAADFTITTPLSVAV
jgi:hypothetical protein